MARRGARREQRHVDRRPPRSRWLSWLPETVVALVVVAALANLEFDLGHRWFGLEAVGSGTRPAEVLPPEGLDLTAGPAAPPVAVPVSGGPLDSAAVEAALARYADDSRFGARLSFQVSEVGSGQVVFREGVDRVIPASTTKLLTGAAALESLGPSARFTTRVVSAGEEIVLVGGGDPFLASSAAKAKGLYPGRADLGTLARRTAVALKARGQTTVTLAYDTGLFEGPAVNPRWPANYRPDNVVPPITALWADQGEGPNGRYVADPASSAAKAFAVALRRAGIEVAAPEPGSAVLGAEEIAAVQSAPVGVIVERMISVSDNNAAEVLARHVAIAMDEPATFAGGSIAILKVLDSLGMDVAGSRVHDGSGLSRESQVRTALLLEVLGAAASPEFPRLRAVITGLPVAGFTGSLQDRFDTGEAEGRGRVRAKTGTLTGVHGLAGIAADQDGTLMAFVLVADRVSVPNTLPVRRLLDQMAAALGACRCGVR